jgi:integrase
MILLGINCGYGNSDVATLPTRAVDLEHAWIDFPRPKTGIPRRCSLWPETVAAIRQWLAVRPNPKSTEDAGFLFITAHGNRWQRTGVSEPDPKTGKLLITNTAPVTPEFAKVVRGLSIKRPGVGFYSLRNTLETIGGAAKDQVALNSITGRVDSSMSAVYRERIDDTRLKAVTDHVRQWLFGQDVASEAVTLENVLAEDAGGAAAKPASKPKAGKRRGRPPRAK